MVSLGGDTDVAGSLARQPEDRTYSGHSGHEQPVSNGSGVFLRPGLKSAYIA